jgi:hypothetical protein
MAVALKRRHAYDVPLLRGRPDTIARDALFMGTALSAPVVMLAAQGVAAARLLRRPSGPERLVLGGLGAVMVVGYFAESLVRQRLWVPKTRPGFLSRSFARRVRIRAG